MLDDKTTKSTKENLITINHRGLDCFHHSFNDLHHNLFLKACLCCNLCYYFCFCHNNVIYLFFSYV